MLNQAAIEAVEALVDDAEAEKTAAVTARNQAEGFATSANTSKNTATTKAGEALASANNAHTSEVNAAASEANANTSKNAATTKAGEALASANNAHTSEVNAAASEANANTSKNTATTKAAEALASAGNASASEANALTYKNQALGFRNEAEGFKDTASTAAVASVAAFKGAWVANTSYNQGEQVTNGGNTYRKKVTGATGSVFDASLWDVVAQGGAVADGTITPQKLNTFLQNLVQQLPDDSPYLYAIVDTMSRLALGIRKADGFIEGRFVINAISMMVNAVHTAAIQSEAVTMAKLSADVKSGLASTYDATYSNYLYMILDTVGRIAFSIKKDGTVEGKFAVAAANILANAVATAAIQSEAVTMAKLSAEIKAGLSTVYDATDNDYLFMILDAVGRIGFAIKKDATVIAKIQLANGTVTEAMLSSGLAAKIPNAAYNRLNAPNAYDVATEDDNLWRGVLIDIPAKTEATGYGFAQFPPVKTKTLRGLNNTGTSLQFAKTNGIVIRGKRYRGTFNPTASGIVGSNLIGRYGNSVSNTYPAFPAGSTGDCWVIDCGNTTATKTANSLTFKNGDLLVKTAGGYDIQPGPGDGTFLEGDFWNVTNDGTFGATALLATGRILMLGYESASGPKFVKYLASKTGEFYVMGEADPSTFTPSSPRTGDLFVFSAAGTTQSVTGITGDSLIYDGGWGLSASQLVTIANGLAFALPCENARDWQVRRTDKSTTVVTITAKGQAASLPLKVNDLMLLLSDSMFGVNNVGGNILTLSGRTGTVLSYGGGTSNDVLAMLRYHLRNGDLYKARVCQAWHGQNNSTDVTQIKIAAYEMSSIFGSVQKRFVFWSVLGAAYATWNGTRIVVAQNEDAKAGTNFIYQTEQFYEAAFPNQFFNTRKALLESAVGRTAPHPQFPEMTEEQAASTYGVVPFSYHFDYTGKPFTAANITFLGYHSAAGLPTGGVDKNYYVRTGNGTVGQLIVNVAGTWTEYVHDPIHLSPAGSLAVATKNNEYLTLKNI